MMSYNSKAYDLSAFVFYRILLSYTHIARGLCTSEACINMSEKNHKFLCKPLKL